jgi:hypothetical protein
MSPHFWYHKHRGSIYDTLLPVSFLLFPPHEPPVDYEILKFLSNFRNVDSLGMKESVKLFLGLKPTEGVVKSQRKRQAFVGRCGRGGRG